MRRGGWRKRAENDGWEKWGGYMAAKVQKLEEQFQSDATMQKDGTSSTIFSGVAIYVNGYTDPSAEELRKLMMLHGGQYHVYYSRSKTTHIIATNLPNAKIKELKGEKVIRPEWIVESIKAGRLLSYIPYQLYSKQSSVQKSLNFNPVCKPEDPVPGPSNVAKQLNNRVNHIIKTIETENEVKVNGMSSWNEEDASNDFSFVELEQIFPGSKQNGIPHHRDSTVVFNGHTHSSNGALKTQDCLMSMGNSVASRLSPDPALEEEKAEKNTTDYRDYIVQQLQQSPRNTDALRNPHRTNSFSLSSLHSNTKINGAHHSTVQGPSSTKSTSSVPTVSKAASSVPFKPSDCSFISDFYSRSRLHHISMWKCELTEFVNTLQRQSSGIFPGREKLKKMKTGRSALVVTDTGNMSVLSSPRHQSCIMHVDMDCFFVSVGIRNRPDLKGKPVAVTSNRGTGRAPLRPGTNPQLEWQYYQNKILKGKADISDSSMWENQDSAQTNGIDSVLSKAEIASCSYEARQVGIKNGMFFGQAKQLCPNLQAVPYDFHAYKEVARMMYETLASYTHNIEAVSCDEALVDITEILAETRLTPDEFANAVRTEIKDQTKCAASVGIGSNILLARMATRKAKPDGQYHLKPEEVDDFIRGQLVTNLPGVGRSMESKLTSLGIKTCGDLQYMTMAKLQREFGPKTGQMLYRFCRGLDDRPVRTEKERKSVSAEINYGIRFTQSKEAEAFLLNLSEEIQRRLESAGMKGKRLTLKIMVRKPGAPLETAKFGGHGICDNIARGSFCSGMRVPSPDTLNTLKSSLVLPKVQEKMNDDRKNASWEGYFVLLGFSKWPHLEVVLFTVISMFYVMTLVGNLFIITLSYLDSHLHTPMYFFLSNLSLLDLCYTTSSVPQLLVNLWGPEKTISYAGCMAQLYFFLALGSTECVLLVVMSFDRYVAVCRPLHYTVLMHPRFCQWLAVASWVSGFAASALHSSFALWVPLCGHHQLDHFFCELPALLRLSCVDIRANELTLLVMSSIFVLIPLILILSSYGAIARAVLRMQKTSGLQKIFGTCGAHLMVVALFFIPAMCTYLQPPSGKSQDQGKFIALFYTVVTPSLNPLIYTLRNKDVRAAVKRLMGRERDM